MEDKFPGPPPKSLKDVRNDAQKARLKAKNFIKMGEEESLRGLGNLGERNFFTLVSKRDGNA